MVAGAIRSTAEEDAAATTPGSTILRIAAGRPTAIEARLPNMAVPRAATRRPAGKPARVSSPRSAGRRQEPAIAAAARLVVIAAQAPEIWIAAARVLVTGARAPEAWIAARAAETA